MMRFLVVGCGGSGGHTLAYLMDQLRSDLAKDGVDRLPAGWQFLFFDVPTAIQKGPEGVGNVEQQRGTYHGLGPRGGSYPALDYVLSERLRHDQGGGVDGLGQLGTWACQRPDEEETAVDLGAGQFRAIGRTVLLSKAGEVRDLLDATWKTLEHTETHDEMERVSWSTGSRYDRRAPALVLVVSSMAGGAGASMALDVCRLLSMVPNTNPSKVAVFMVSPDVFDTLPAQARTGVRANALAMLGEIVASQTGAARRHDTELLRSLGVTDTVGHHVPFARVFPVGRTVGTQRAIFGEGTPDAVYRGLARGLAGLMTSDVASEEFASFDLGNRGYVEPDPRLMGWGAAPAPLPWGSFGFASISMGRDRYAEYAAQRISRAAVDRLLDGHLRSGSTATSGTAEVQALVAAEWPTVCQTLGLPARLTGAQAATELENWFAGVAVPRSGVESRTAQIADQVLALTSPQVSQAQHWLEHVRRAIAAAKPAAQQQAEDFAYRSAVTWVFDLQHRVESMVTQAVGRYGLVYGRALVERVGELLTNTLMPGLKALSERPIGDLSTLPVEIETVVAATRGTISGGQDWIARVVAEARLKLGLQIYTSSAGHISRALRDFVPGLLSPLGQSLSDSIAVLDAARRAVLTHDGLARLETDLYPAWPAETDQRVPERFGEANNELMLTPSRVFADQFADDIATCLTKENRGPVPLATVTTQVVTGLWESTGEPAPAGLVSRKLNWWPRAFGTDPASGQTVRAQEGQYDLAVRPDQIRQRAKAFVRRKDESFDIFVSTNLRAYLEGKDASRPSEVEIQRRQRELVAQFRRALDLAVPLSSVNAQAVKVMYRSRGEGQEVQYVYKFSQVPLGALSVADDILALIRHDSLINDVTPTNFERALTAEGNPRRIDIFGSYPLYLPLAFNSILDPVINEWNAVQPEGARLFWTMRRARPLDAALPMSDNERRAMVTGWYVGQIVGELEIPPEPYTTPVRIWDPSERRWVAFPHPLLTPPSQFRFRQDWLPAVLESSLLAIAAVHRAPIMSSLRPYQLLRELYDGEERASQEGRGLLAVAGQRKLAAWLRSGTSSDRPSRIPAIAAATTPEERYDAAVEWISGARGPAELVRQHFLPGGRTEDGKPGAYVRIDSRKQATSVPLLYDLAPDVAFAADTIVELLHKARRMPDPAGAGVGGTVDTGEDRPALPDWDAF